MPKQFVLNHVVRLVSALALLAAVMTSPIRPSKAASGTSQPDYLRRNFGIPRHGSTHRTAVPHTSRVVQVKALSSQTRLDWTTHPARHHDDLARTDSREPRRASSAFHLDRAPHPLRC
jgi:hypothetical protein